MNLLYINFVESRDGLGTLDVYTPLKELSRKGHKVILLTENDGNKSYKINYKSNGSLEVQPFIPLKNHSIKAPLLEVVLMYLNAPLIFLRLIKVIRTKRPQILLSCSDYSLPPISFFASKLTKTPLVLVHRETHLESFYYFPNYSYLVKHVSLFLSRINLIFYKKTKSIAISESIKIFLKQRLKLNDIYTINLLCTNIGEIKKESCRLSDSKEPVILYSGLFSRIRGIDVLFRAFNVISKKYPDSKLLITGKINQGEWNFLKKNLDKHSVEKVSFTGFLSKSAVLKLMLSSSICIDPSSTNSWNPSGKIAEYMTCGKCVITTNTYTHRFFIEDDINGLLFEANNVDDLIKKMDLSLGDSKYREKLGNQARATSEERFDVKQIAPIFEVFLKERIDEHSILNKPKKSDRR